MTELDILELADTESITLPARVLKHYINKCNLLKEEVLKTQTLPTVVVSELLNNYTPGNIHTYNNGYTTAYDFMNSDISGDITIDSNELRNVINNMRSNTVTINKKDKEIVSLKQEVEILKEKLKVARELNILKQPLHIKGIQTYVDNMLTII